MVADFGIKIFCQEIKFIAGVAKASQLPKLFLPQMAFLGKSNVGKSSLINAICRKKALARVSHTPGRTQQINFFSIADKILLVDLPGYGFAKVAKSQRDLWERLIIYYLQSSNSLQIINLLIDARRGIKNNDIEIIEFLKSYKKKFQIVFTKVDKVNINEIFLLNVKEYLTTLGCSCNVIITSSKSGIGVKEVQHSMIQFTKELK